VPLNPEINPERYEHTSQVRDLKPDGQVPSQEANKLSHAQFTKEVMLCHDLAHKLCNSSFAVNVLW
jgi:hypothetical protein